MLGKPNTSGRLVKWAVELSEYDIYYLPKTTIKAQALADFISVMIGTSEECTSQAEKWLLHDVGARHVIAYSDSQLIVNQIEGSYEVKEENMIQYVQQIAELKTKFDGFPREENIKADCLSKFANALEDCRTRRITIKYLPQPRTPICIQVVSSSNDWRAPVIRWLEEGLLPSDR
ncbi:UNVERIFIED_CONTAM: hypothetical protein Sindi_0731300 [Sesamum indicum]